MGWTLIIVGLLLFCILLQVTIIVHELGHYMMCRYYRIEVEKFCIGMGFTLFSFKKKNTEFIVNLIPFGGYNKHIKISDDKQNILVSLAGVGMNFIVMIACFLIISSLSSFSVTNIFHVVDMGYYTDNLRFAILEGNSLISRSVIGTTGILMWFNIVFIVGNLIPLPPIDGYHVLVTLIKPEKSWKRRSLCLVFMIVGGIIGLPYLIGIDVLTISFKNIVGIITGIIGACFLISFENLGKNNKKTTR